jgi:hypothetical protein
LKILSVKRAAAVFVLALWFAVVSPFAALSALGADFEFQGKIEAQDPVSRLLAYYVAEFSPEELFLSVDGQPDDSGRIRDLYMDLTGVLIGEVRVDKLVFRINDVQFNSPSEWASGSVECVDALQIYAYCLLKEEDINRRLAEDTFGDDDHWSDIKMKISPSGLYARGTYAAKVLFVTLNIMIEVESGLKIVENRTLWLDGYKVRVNAVDVPDYITRKAVEQIQPILDLGRFPLPLKLHKVSLEDGRATLSTRIPPEPIQDGITYRYLAE